MTQLKDFNGFKIILSDRSPRHLQMRPSLLKSDLAFRFYGPKPPLPFSELFSETQNPD